MNANTLVDLLLELNIVNIQDVDREINKLAARVADPRAQKWFRRVPRFFLINIDRLLKEPYVAKAEPRGIRQSKYYADPRGGFLKGPGREPEPQPGSPLPVREQYDPKKQTYTTTLHEPVVQKDIQQSFTPFKPKKAKAKEVFGGPPTKSQLQPWMTAPGAEEKEFVHFDPIQMRRRELYGKFEALVNYLNYQFRLIQRPDPEDDKATANAQEAEKLMRRLETMKTDDIEGFRDVMQDAANFMGIVKDKPWFFTKDGQTVATHNNLVMRKVVYPETAVVFSKRGQPTRTSQSDPNNPDLYWPVWCTKTLSYAENYTNQGPLYFIDKDDRPYVLAHFPSHQVYNVHDRPLDSNVVKEIAPLFVDEKRFPTEELSRGSQELANEVSRLRSQRLRRPER